MSTKTNKITFQFLSEPSDINFGGKVHGGVVMKWIDQSAYACARNWAESYCVTIYVGGIRFYKSIKIGDVVKVESVVLHTGTSSIHIGVDVYAKSFEDHDFEKKTHCIIVFVAVDESGKSIPVPKWVATSDQEILLEQYAIKLKNLRQQIEEEMKSFLQ